MSANLIRWCMVPTVCYRCRRVLWLVRAVDRLLRPPPGLPCGDVWVKHCLVCVALEKK